MDNTAYTTHLQNYLKKYTHDELQEQYNIKVKTHPSFPLYTYNYKSFEQKLRKHDIVRESRGIVLDDQQNLIALPFKRFFNLGEYIEDDNQIKWDECDVISKEDGTLIIVYFYKNQWYIKTRQTWGDDLMPIGEHTWNNFFWNTVGQKLRTNLRIGYTYCFELCSLFNKIVRHYIEPQVFLLGVFDQSTGKDLDIYEHYRFYLKNKHHNLKLPQKFEVISKEDLYEKLKVEEEKNPEFEGFVLRSNGMRFKIKTQSYLNRFMLFDNGNILNPKNILTLIINDDDHHAITLRPELKPYFNQIREKINIICSLVENEYKKIDPSISQKDFAAAIDKSPYKSILFNMRQGNLSAQEALFQLRLKAIVQVLK